MRKILIVVGIVLAVVIVVVAAVPFFIDANKYKPLAEEQAQKALGRKVSLGQIELSIWRGGLVLHDISISDDPAFSKQPFLEARSLSVGVALWPYITSREVQVRSITLEEPQIRMVSNSAGRWNFSTIGKGSASTPPKSAPSASAPGAISIANLSISNGKLSVVTGGREHIYDDVNVKVSDFAMDSRFPLTVGLNTPGGGSVKIDGKVGPLNEAAVASSPADLNIMVKDFDVSQTGFLPPGSPLAGKMDYEGSLQSDGKKLTGEGKATFNKLKIAAGGAPASVPVSLDYATEYQTEAQTGKVTKGLVHIGGSTAILSGTFMMKGENLILDDQFVGNGMKIDDLAGLLPAVGVVMPSGSKVTGGTFSTTLTIKGPAGGATITGPVHIVDSKIANFNLQSRAKDMASIAGLKLGNDIDLKNVSTSVVVAPDGIKTDNISAVSTGLGTVTGAGTVSNSGNLNYKMKAKLEAGGAGGALIKVASAGSGEVPFSITGTTANPVFIPDMAGMMKGMASGTGTKVQDLGKSLGGLFKKKN